MQQYGSPLFLFYPARLKRNIETYREAFEDSYPNVTLCYSTKTNYVPAIVRKVSDYGVAPEAIPGMELDILEKLSLLGERAVINGPLKTRSELERIVSAGARINVDNWTELEVLQDVAAQQRRVVRIGIRVCGRIDDETWLRFGFNVDSGLARRAAEAIATDFPNLQLSGLHIHLGTNLLEAGIYARAAEMLCDFAQNLAADGLIDLEYLDLGGGFATDCPFLDAAPEEWQVPSAKEYADAIASKLLEAYPDDPPELLIEPGRALVDDTFDLIATVQRMRGEQNEVIVDAGQNIFSSCRYRRHPVSYVGDGGEASERWTLFGPLCMQSDCIGRNVPLPSLAPGDLIKIGYAGAYSLSQSWQFIRYQPAIVMIEDGVPKLVRAAQNADNGLSNYVFNI